QNPTVGFGGQIAKYGGGIAAAAGLMDAVQYVFAGIRVSGQGDRIAAVTYPVAGSLAASSALIGITSSISGSSALLGPTGIVIILGLTAYALASWAKQQESSALETWARQSCWGTPTEHRIWQTEKDQDTATTYLNAAMLGLSASIDITVNFQTTPSSHPTRIWDGFSIPSSRLLVYHMTLPAFRSEHSKYEWRINAFRASHKPPCNTYTGNSNELAADFTKLKSPTEISPPDIAVFSRKNSPQIIKNTIVLDEYDDIHAVELTLTYWPDKSNVSEFAQIIVKKDKIGLLDK
ncbi:hypothetical protein IRZ60_10700, partial [Pseudomonas guariconensis]|nr:hypothetical protein [Pseudomonas guariconensis]MBF8751052.1 hypothetical protein [Pseudomonas guariconensis]